MEYDEFGNPLFEEELSDDESQGSASPTRLDREEDQQQPLRDFDEDQQEEGQGMQLDGKNSFASIFIQERGLAMLEARKDGRK